LRLLSQLANAGLAVVRLPVMRHGMLRLLTPRKPGSLSKTAPDLSRLNNHD
jgi:hypothetical protein